MRLRQIHIKNLKAISDLTIAFDEKKEGKTITLLYGNNGVGKTTILEAISLLGHVSAMRRFCVPDDVSKMIEKGEDSKFLEMDASNENISFESIPFDLLQKKIVSSQGLEEWFTAFNEREAAAIAYTVETRLAGMKANVHTFYIYFKQDYELITGKRPLSITQALSRGTSDDVEMNNLFALVYTKADKADIENLIKHLYENTSHYVREKEDDENRGILRKQNDYDKGSHLVSYINTDLNDFGRKNDIRESVKDMLAHFGIEIIGRLRLPFDDPEKNGEFRFKKELNEYLDAVIKDYSTVVPRRTRKQKQEQPLFEITELFCCRKDASGEYNIMVKAKRLGEEPDEIFHMSAGENECFFIFMTLLGLPIKKSLILLDEPDLHLTTLAKTIFYKKLFEILREKECQVIISTHSLFAYSAGEKEVERQRIKRVVRNDGQIDYSANYDRDYFYHLHGHYLKTARRALGAIKTKEVASYLWSQVWGSLDRKAEKNQVLSSLLIEWIAIFIPFLLAFAFLAIPGIVSSVGALLNDALVPDLIQHDIWRRRLPQIAKYGTYVFAGLLLLFVAIRRIKRKKRKTA